MTRRSTFCSFFLFSLSLSPSLSLPIISQETFFRSQIVFFNIDQIYIFSFLLISFSSCRLFFFTKCVRFSLHASRLMFIVVIQLTLLDRTYYTTISTSSSSIKSFMKQKRRKKNKKSKLIKIRVISSETKCRTDWHKISSEENDDASGWICWTVPINIFETQFLLLTKESESERKLNVFFS